MTVEKMLGQLAYLEVTSPDIEASAEFYETKFGMRIIDRIDGRIYLRCWGDYFRYSVVLSEEPTTRLVTMAWRTESEAALEALAERVEATGVTGHWSESGNAVGRSYSFVGPYGHRMTLLWEYEQFVAEPGFESVYPDRPEKRCSHGAAPRFLDHVTIASSDVEGFAQWYSSTLGFRIMGRTLLDDVNINVFTVLTTNEKSHDLGIVLDSSSVAGRIHHIAFWVDHPEDLARAADLMIENGTAIEFGPSVHGIGEQNFLYFREPSTLRVEVNSGGYRNYVSDWGAKTWSPAQGSVSFFRNANPPDSMMEAFPSAVGLTATEDGTPAKLRDALISEVDMAANR